MLQLDSFFHCLGAIIIITLSVNVAGCSDIQIKNKNRPFLSSKALSEYFSEDDNANDPDYIDKNPENLSELVSKGYYVV